MRRNKRKSSSPLAPVFSRRARGRIFAGFPSLVGQFFDGPVEIAGGLFGFQPPALLLMQVVLGMSVFLGQSVRNVARVREDLAVAQPQEIVQLGNPIGHVHRG
jgi:hypothetical protein